MGLTMQGAVRFHRWAVAVNRKDHRPACGSAAICEADLRIYLAMAIPHAATDPGAPTSLNAKFASLVSWPPTPHPWSVQATFSLHDHGAARNADANDAASTKTDKVWAIIPACFAPDAEPINLHGALGLLASVLV